MLLCSPLLFVTAAWHRCVWPPLCANRSSEHYCQPYSASPACLAWQCCVWNRNAPAPITPYSAAESMSPTGDAARHQRSNSLGDRAEGEAALAAARARGQVRVGVGERGGRVVVGFSG